jgi:hypothetical protein
VKSKPAIREELPPVEEAVEKSRFGAGWMRFWFTPASPTGLHIVRVLAGLLFLSWLLPQAGYIDELHGLNGWFDRQAFVEAARLPEGALKPMSWSVFYLCGTNTTLIHTVYWASVFVVVLLTLGVATRITAPLTWVVVASFTANPALDHEGDPMMLILAFYLMVGYLLLGLNGAGTSWRHRIFGFGRGPSRSVAANVALRLLQVHVAIVVLTTGFHKLQIGDWWAGMAHWAALYPPFETTVAEIRALQPHAQAMLFFLNVAAYSTLAWELSFPLWAWRPGWWRIVLVGGALVGWIGTAFIYRIPQFGPALFIGCLAFIRGEEWAALGRLLKRLPGVSELALRWGGARQGETNLKRGAVDSLVTVGQR